MAKHPAVGDQAPDFELEGTRGAFKLSDHRGEKVMLLFYPGDETTVCTKQFCSYRVAHRHDHAIGLDFQTVADLEKTLDGLPAAA